MRPKIRKTKTPGDDVDDDDDNNYDDDDDDENQRDVTRRKTIVSEIPFALQNEASPCFGTLRAQSSVHARTRKRTHWPARSPKARSYTPGFACTSVYVRTREGTRIGIYAVVCMHWCVCVCVCVCVFECVLEARVHEEDRANCRKEKRNEGVEFQ